MIAAYQDRLNQIDDKIKPLCNSASSHSISSTTSDTCSAFLSPTSIPTSTNSNSGIRNSEIPSNEEGERIVGETSIAAQEKVSDLLSHPYYYHHHHYKDTQASLNHYTPAEDHQTKLERLTGGAITSVADSKSNGDKTEIASKLPPS